MKSDFTIEYEFVDLVPRELKEGTLYISIEFATATHKCFCGCGTEVVTPISPVGWQVKFDGETVSLSPSVGSWSLKCKSHYSQVEETLGLLRRPGARAPQHLHDRIPRTGRRFGRRARRCSFEGRVLRGHLTAMTALSALSSATWMFRSYSFGPLAFESEMRFLARM